LRKNRGKTLDWRGVVPIIGPSFFCTFHRAAGEEKEVIMRSIKIWKRVYDVSVRDIPEG
jgi:squalene cyclase